jgi:hypothetical protein
MTAMGMKEKKRRERREREKTTWIIVRGQVPVSE